eukprot:CAMPEP_0179980672 /NCGR_PEP_ID=MMETSP0983-20121128/42073_1 /TAXON_ID=483367 /ORGANISM="non described non described, Strain CCMP 2436" /LENGTH=43 /DNA_ID= /DNA_START= /DNA_END= /DNA_ORIENTATION=
MPRRPTVDYHGQVYDDHSSNATLVPLKRSLEAHSAGPSWSAPA